MKKAKLVVIIVRAVILIVLGIIAFSFDSAPYYRTIFSVGIFASVFYYRKSQFVLEFKAEKTRLKPKINDRLLLYPIFTVFFAVCFADLWQKQLVLPISIAGFFAYAFGTLFYSLSINELGKFFSTGIEIKEKHSLIKTGPYRLVRHPAYFGSLFFALGLVLMANSLFGFIIFVFAFLPWLALRILREEKALEKEFGAKYSEYKKKTKLIIPKVF